MSCLSGGRLVAEKSKAAAAKQAANLTILAVKASMGKVDWIYQ
jgi:hypothetical protein